MPDPIEPQPTIPTTPGLTPQDLRNQQVAQQQQLQAQNQLVQQQLQQNANKPDKGIFRRIQNRTIRRGSLIAFNYGFYKHDPTPLCLVGKLWPNGMISGLNLHYLTYRYVKQLIQVFCGKEFHYGLIKGNKYIVNSYRSYKREARRNIRVLDCDFLLGVLGSLRSFKPNEIEAMRQQVQQQLRDRMHPNAEQMAQQFQQAVRNQSHKDYNIGLQQPDARFNPTDIIAPE